MNKSEQNKKYIYNIVKIILLLIGIIGFDYYFDFSGLHIGGTKNENKNYYYKDFIAISSKNDSIKNIRDTIYNKNNKLIQTLKGKNLLLRKKLKKANKEIDSLIQMGKDTSQLTKTVQILVRVSKKYDNLKIKYIQQVKFLKKIIHYSDSLKERIKIIEDNLEGKIDSLKDITKEYKPLIDSLKNEVEIYKKEVENYKIQSQHFNLENEIYGLGANIPYFKKSKSTIHLQIKIPNCDNLKNKLENPKIRLCILNKTTGKFVNYKGMIKIKNLSESIEHCKPYSLYLSAECTIDLEFEAIKKIKGRPNLEEKGTKYAVDIYLTDPNLHGKILLVRKIVNMKTLFGRYK